MKQALLLLLLVGCGGQASDQFAQSRKDLAAATVKKYTNEAFPLWAQAHPSKACPANVEELNEYMNIPENKDLWGQPYRLFCGDNLPPGARTFAVSSNGPDGKPDTADDIKSW